MTQAEKVTTSDRSQWPSLRVEDWTPTRETLHMWMQIVGKIRLAKAPMVNHWWQVPLYVTPPIRTTPVEVAEATAFEDDHEHAAYDPAAAQLFWRQLAQASRVMSQWGDGEGMFYAYAYPEPDGFAEYPIGPPGAFYYRDGGQFVLPYQTVREAADPDAVLLEFLQTTYEAAAVRGGWDRAALEDDPERRAQRR